LEFQKTLIDMATCLPVVVARARCFAFKTKGMSTLIDNVPKYSFHLIRRPIAVFFFAVQKKEKSGRKTSTKNV
jgi:hypothetical protein